MARPPPFPDGAPVITLDINPLYSGTNGVLCFVLHEIPISGIGISDIEPLVIHHALGLSVPPAVVGKLSGSSDPDPRDQQPRGGPFFYATFAGSSCPLASTTSFECRTIRNRKPSGSRLGSTESPGTNPISCTYSAGIVSAKEHPCLRKTIGLISFVIH
jgi:hypothetical protein